MNKKIKSKKIFFTTKATNLSFFSKFIIVVLIIGILLNSCNIGIIIKAMTHETEDIVLYEENNEDLSILEEIGEEESLRTKNTKTYKKVNGLYETEYYTESIHYKKNGKWEDIDNTLKESKNKKYYYNNSNRFMTNFPVSMSKDDFITINYFNNDIKIYRELEESRNINAKLNNKTNRENKNLKDELSYKLSEYEELQYIIKQDSIKENVILKEYIENYKYDYYIDTELRLERIGNVYYFFNENEVIFIMNEYIMIDSLGNESKEINVKIEVIDNDTYKIEVIPNNEYLKNASYPLTIDPEIIISDNGRDSGLFNVILVDDSSSTQSLYSIGSFTINNRIESDQNDDIRAYFDITIPTDYIGDMDSNNVINTQFMYAHITVPTLSTTSTHETKVYLNKIISDTYNVNYLNKASFSTQLIDTVTFHNSTIFDHKFDIYNLLKEKIIDYAAEDINLKFELLLSGSNNTTVTYSLGSDVGGLKPALVIGYFSEAGLANYYTYESFPMNEGSNIFVSHNSGNLICLLNDFDNGNLLNFSHIYNTNRKHQNSYYGSGFSINYNERVETINRYYRLIEGDGREILYYPTEVANEFIATDGSGNILKITQTGYEIITTDNIKKIYNIDGYITKIYKNYLSPNDYLNFDYTTNKLTMVEDSYGNYINFTYTSNRLTSVSVYLINKNDGVSEIENVYTINYTYEGLRLVRIKKYKQSTLIKTINIEYDEDNKKHLSKIYDENNRGYTFVIDELNRVTEAKIWSNEFTNGNYINFTYDTTGKKTVLTDGLGQRRIYTFDNYNHTNSIENNNNEITFYKYEDIYYESNGNSIVDVNYNKNHKIILSSNSFKNDINLINNHGFETSSGSIVNGWTKNISGGATATINTASALFGSKVLQLTNTSNGTCEVYQDIIVESGKEYVVSGYIRNTNTSSNGAYIEVTPITGTFSNVIEGVKIKGSKNFERFEYKFTSNYTGKARIKLINTSSGLAYFDNIQLSDNYIDTRYNYLENSSFENTVFDENTVPGWTITNGYSIQRQDTVFLEHCGSKSVVLNTGGVLKQTINLSGEKGDIFVFGGYAHYENYKGKAKVTLKITYTTGSTKTQEFIFDNSDINSRYMMDKVEVNNNYSKIEIIIENLSQNSKVFLDNFAIYKEGFGLNIEYNDDGTKKESFNEITLEKQSYEYTNGLLTTKKIYKADSLIDTTSYSYDENEYLNSILNNNITTSINTDEFGNIESINLLTGDVNNIYYSSTTYTIDGIFPSTTTDVLGNETSYEYDYLTGLIKKIIDANDIETSYSYDNKGNVLNVTTGKNNNTKTITYTYDSYGNVTSLSMGGLTYTFVYNKYNDLKQVKVGNETIVTNYYENEDSSTEIYSSKITSSDYSYGTIQFEYNDSNLISSIYYELSSKVKIVDYKYNENNQVSSYTDYKENVTYYFNYDLKNNLVNINSTDGREFTYEYNDKNLLTGKTNNIYSSTYSYHNYGTNGDENYLIDTQTIDSSYNIVYSYTPDSSKFIQSISYYLANSTLINVYTHETTLVDGISYYTGRIKSVSYTSGNNEIMNYTYTYDDYNNITNIVGKKNSTVVYNEVNTYDIFNQLVSQIITIDGQTYLSEYVYDIRGNVTSYFLRNITNNITLKNYSFTYLTENNIDTLSSVTSYTDNTTHNISYDVLGQPNQYMEYNLNYNMNNLISIIGSTTDIVYSYNANGIRTKKIVAIGQTSTTTNYTLEQDKIIKEVRTGSQNITLKYYYDINEEIIGFDYNNTKYMYIKNIQNDIIGILDSNNNIIVKYYYDGYGNIIHITDTSGINLSNINPFRYRSYYYDTETGWYYLNSRYYNPETLRFISMDSIEYLGVSNTILSTNLFSYCENNPINYSDKTGNISEWIIPMFMERVGLLIATTIGVLDVLIHTMAGVAVSYLISSLPTIALEMIIIEKIKKQEKKKEESKKSVPIIKSEKITDLKGLLAEVVPGSVDMFNGIAHNMMLNQYASGGKIATDQDLIDILLDQGYPIW